MRMLVLLLLAAVAPQLVSSRCGVSRQPSLSDKIVGGRDAEEGEFPWQASLMKLTYLGLYHTCGASLLTPTWLVTAAHCITVKSVSGYRIMIGNNNLSAVMEDQLYSIQMIVIKKDFDKDTFHNDIALVRVSRPVSGTLSSICLTEEPLSANTTGVVTGWGATLEGGRAAPYLQVAEVSTILREDCLAYYPLTDSMTCAGYEEGGIDACQGDSGGPLLQWRKQVAYLVGVVSWGVGCAEPGHPGVYTDVFQFVPWIQHYIAPAK